MNRAWMALAGLAALGAAAVGLDLRDHAAGRMAAAECAAYFEDVAAAETTDPVAARFLRDVLRIAVQCGLADPANAARDIEAALRTDLDESAILMYADVLLAGGHNARAAPWVRSAIAVSLTWRHEDAGPFAGTDIHTPWLIRAIDRTKAALDSGNARRIAGELEAYFARPPRAPLAEHRLLRIGLERLESADPRESLYWQGLLREWTDEFFPEFPKIPSRYPAAIACGDRRAMRRLGTLYLSGKTDDHHGRSAYYGLVLIADPTAEERALLAALEPRFGKTPLDMSHPLTREGRSDIHAIDCERVLRFIANRNR